MALLLRCGCGQTIPVDAPGAPGAAVKCAACGSDVPVPDRAASLEETGAIQQDAVLAARAARAAGAGAETDAQLSDTGKLRLPEGDLATADTRGDDEPLEPGRCGLCGLRNRRDDVLCEGCGTSLLTGEPPPVERFRPRRFDTRLAIGAGILVLASAIGLGVLKIVRAGADRRAVERGDILAAKQDWRGAEGAYIEATLANERNPRAWAGIATARLRLGAGPASALDSAEKAVRLFDEDPAAPPADAAPARLALGRVKLERGEVEDGARLLEQAAEGRTDLPDLRHFLGHARFLKGEKAEAAAAYEQALAHDPRSQETPLSKQRLGALLVERGKLPAAEKLLHEAIAEGAPKADAWASLGDLYVRKGDSATALGMYRNAAQADAGRARTWFMIARLERSGRKLDAALEAAQRAAEIDPGKGEHLKLVGAILEEKGDPERAAAAYREAGRAGPEDAEVPYLLAKLDAARGERAKAREGAEAALAKDPRFVPALDLVGRLAIDARDWRGAEDAYKKALQAAEGRAELWFGLGTAYDGLGRAADALNAFRKAVDLDRNHLHAWHRIAEAHLAAGRAGEAGQALGEIVRIAPEDPQPKIRLAKIHADAKRFGPAKELLADVLKREPGHAEAKQLLDKVTYLEFQEQSQ